MKNYSVEVLSKESHGRYGKSYFFGMCVSAANKKMAESFVEELVDDMTFDEFLEWCVDDMKSVVKSVCYGEKPLCSFKAYVGC